MASVYRFDTLKEDLPGAWKGVRSLVLLSMFEDGEHNSPWIAKKYGFPQQTIRKAFAELCKRGYIMRIKNGDYMLDHRVYCALVDKRHLLG